MDMKIGEVRDYKYKIDTENYHENGYPKKCKHCNSDKIKEKVTDTFNYMACEIEYRCEECNKVIAFWGYGNFEADFFVEVTE